MGEAAGIYARESAYLDRYVQIGLASGRVVSISFPETPDEGVAGADHELLERVEAYLEGREDDFADVEVGLTLPTDRRSVLETLRKVGYGDQVSVEQLARMTPGLSDEGEDTELVRGTLDENPVPLVIPDHRVRDGPSAAPPAVEQRLRSLEGL